jgi:hypothetical protein
MPVLAAGLSSAYVDADRKRKMSAAEAMTAFDTVAGVLEKVFGVNSLRVRLTPCLGGSV